MQSKRQIEQLLLSAGVRPNKRFGQHFLIDLNLMRLLIDSANIQKNDVVLEVGCGTGSLTEAITEKAGFCVAVEIDAVLAQIAKTRLVERSNLEIIAADVLKSKFEINPVVIDALNRAQSEHKGRLLLVGNLPYAAATPLMLNFVARASPSTLLGTVSSSNRSPCLHGQDGRATTNPVVMDAMFVTVQKEVADRMTAGPGTKDYGILSILLSATGDVKHIRTMKPTVFWPQPQVNSAMISYVRKPEKIRQVKSIETLSKITSGLLQHRRKMLKVGCKMMTGELGTGFPLDFARDGELVEPQPVEARSGIVARASPSTLLGTVSSSNRSPCNHGQDGRATNWPDIFAKCGVDPNNRPDQLTPEQFVSLANLCDDVK